MVSSWLLASRPIYPPEMTGTLRARCGVRESRLVAWGRPSHQQLWGCYLNVYPPAIQHGNGTSKSSIYTTSIIYSEFPIARFWAD